MIVTSRKMGYWITTYSICLIIYRSDSYCWSPATSHQRPSWHLARWRLSELILEINQQDLRFNSTELHILLAEQGHTQVSDVIVQNILLRSEGGWLIALMAVSAKRSC